MQIPQPLAIAMAATLMLMAIGCDEDENTRLAEMAQQHLERQADQNRQMSELQREVAEGSRHLVEADAKAREGMVALQREAQAERKEVGRQRDAMEEERRDLAVKRRLDPIIAAAISNACLLLACLLPLVVSWCLLRQRVEPADDQIVAEILLEDLVASRPLVLTRVDPNPAIGFRDVGADSRFPGDPEQTDEAAG